MVFFAERVVGDFFAVFMRKSDGSVERLPTNPLSQRVAQEMCDELNATLNAVAFVVTDEV